MTEVTQGERPGQAAEGCPPWCRTDHADGTRTFHAGLEWLSNHPFEHEGTYLEVFAIRFGMREEAEVCLSGNAVRTGIRERVYLRPADAAKLATVIELLAGRSEAQLAELGAQLRAAAGQAGGAE